MKKIIVILLLLTSLLATGCIGKNEDDVVKAAEISQENQDAISVKVKGVESIDFVETLTLAGTLEVKEHVIVTSKVNGTIESTFVDIGSKVNKGDSLCKIDDTIYKIQYDKANVELQRANNELDKFNGQDEGFRDQTIESSENQYNTAKLRYENGQKDYGRMQTLHESQAISDVDFEKAEENFVAIESDYSSAKSVYEHAMRNYDYNLKTVELQKESALATYKLAEKNYKDTNVKAPIMGVVAEKNISMGRSVTQGLKLFTIVDSGELYIETGVSERDVASIKIGQKAFVNIDTIKANVEGEVIGVSPILDEKSKTYKVKISVNNEDEKLKGGMFATVEVVIGDSHTSLAVLKTSVVKKSGETFVYVFENDRAQKKIVSIGGSDNDYYEIIEGLKKEDKVIISFNDKVKNGSRVEVKLPK